MSRLSLGNNNRQKPAQKWLYVIAHVVTFADRRQEFHRTVLPFDQRLDQDKVVMNLEAIEQALAQKYAELTRDGIIGVSVPVVEIVSWQLLERVEVDPAKIAAAIEAEGQEA